jgi:hypothetical protein
MTPDINLPQCTYRRKKAAAANSALFLLSFFCGCGTEEDNVENAEPKFVALLKNQYILHSVKIVQLRPWEGIH